MLTHLAYAGADSSALNPTPPVLVGWLSAFRGCFSAPVWSRVLVLVAGAVLAPGKRTVTQALRVMGLEMNPGFSRYHEVLSRARWNGRAVARTLLMQVLATFLPTGEVVLGVDDTIERRWGIRIKARGLYRDLVLLARPLRSGQRPALAVAHGHGADPLGRSALGEAGQGSGRMATGIPAEGLPFLTVLAPSERWSSERGRRHKTVLDWAKLAKVPPA